jgi:hypothetical protein
MESRSEIPNVEQRTDSAGRKQPARKQSTRRKAEQKESQPAPAPEPTLKAYPRLVETASDEPLRVHLVEEAAPPIAPVKAYAVEVAAPPIARKAYAVEVAAPTATKYEPPDSAPEDDEWMTETELAEDMVAEGVKLVEERLRHALGTAFADLQKAHEAKHLTAPVLLNARCELLDRVAALVRNIRAETGIEVQP